MVKVITRQEWGASQSRKPWGKHIPKRIVLHHSWSPTTKQWNGAATIRAIQHYHQFDKATGWPDIAYHFIVSPDGAQVFGCNPVTDLTYHCGTPKLEGNTIAFGNTGSIGICLIGNYDIEIPLPNAVLTLQALINDVCAQNDIKPGQVFGHFESRTPIPPKTCPGLHMVEAFGMADRFARAYPPKK